MVKLLFGENSFEVNQRVRALVADFAGEVERVDGEVLRAEQVPELLLGGTLFSERRAVVIRDPAAQASVWQALGEWLPKVDDDTLVIMTAKSIDKRTKTYKWLQKKAEIIECPAWRDYEAGKARAWLRGYAKEKGVTLPSEIEQAMVERAVVTGDNDKAIIDQVVLAHAVLQLADTDEVTLAALDAILPESSYGNVFRLLELALSGKTSEVQRLVQTLKLREDAHKIAAVLASQTVNLSALVLARGAGIGTAQVAKDIGVHPYALSQMERLASQNAGRLAAIVDEIVTLDARLKSSSGDPWQLIEVALIKLGQK